MKKTVEEVFYTFRLRFRLRFIKVFIDFNCFVQSSKTFQIPKLKPVGMQNGQIKLVQQRNYRTDK